MSIPSPTPDPGDTRVALAPGARLAWRTWNGQTITHHALSNDTHRLAEPAGAVLQSLASVGSQRIDSLARSCDLAQDELEHVLAALAELNLVVQC